MASEKDDQLTWVKAAVDPNGQPVIGKGDDGNVYVQSLEPLPEETYGQRPHYLRNVIGLALSGTVVFLAGGIIGSNTDYFDASFKDNTDTPVSAVGPTNSASPSVSPSPTMSETVVGTPKPRRSETASLSSPAATDITVPAAPLSAAELQACGTRSDGIKTVVLDPGHSGNDDQGKALDPISGLETHDYPNQPEMNEVWQVSQEVASALCSAGYKVSMTKNAADDPATLPEKIKIALEAQPDLMVSIHNDHTQDYGSGNDVYAQAVGQWRGGTAEKPGYTCNNKRIAAQSKAAANIFVQTRTEVEEVPAQLGTVDLSNRKNLQPGNTWFTQLDTCNPGDGYKPVVSIQTEMGAKVGGDEKTPLSDEQLRKYAQGLTSSIVKALKG